MMKTLNELEEQFGGRFEFVPIQGGYLILDTHKQRRRALLCSNLNLVDELERECACLIQQEGNGQ